MTSIKALYAYFWKHLPGIIAGLVAVSNACLLVAHLLGQLQASGLSTTELSMNALLGVVGVILHHRIS